MSLDQHAMTAPIQFGLRPFNCHGAAIYWAAKENGLDDAAAYAAYDRIAGHCNASGANAATSILSGPYGKNFCAGGFPRTTPALDATEYHVGDVIYTPSALYPMHTMIVVALPGGNTIEVRAFNNRGTFTFGIPIPPENDYDDQTRDLATRVYPNEPIYRIPQNTFCGKVFTMTRLLSVGKRSLNLRAQML
jgi:hypothetical protein